MKTLAAIALASALLFVVIGRLVFAHPVRGGREEVCLQSATNSLHAAYEAEKESSANTRRYIGLDKSQDPISDSAWLLAHHDAQIKSHSYAQLAGIARGKSDELAAKAQELRLLRLERLTICNRLALLAGAIASLAIGGCAIQILHRGNKTGEPVTLSN